MRKSLMCGVTVLMAAFLLASAVSTASARNLEINSTNFRVVWENLEFSGGTVACEVTLEGSFHFRTFEKVRGALIGYVTSAAVAHPCINGEGWADNGTERYLTTRTAIQSLPWHLTYEGFEGNLPDITGIIVLLRNASFIVNVPGICLGRYGKAEDNISAFAAVNEEGRITSLTPIEGSNSATLRERLGGFFCPATGALSNSGEITRLGTTELILVRLI